MSLTGPRSPRFYLVAFAAAVLLVTTLTSTAARAQDLCGVAGGIFQIDGQFYSSNGYLDWAQGSIGTAVFDDFGSPILLSSLYDRDAHWAGKAVDPDHFDGKANKNNDDISAGMHPWTWSQGSGPAKNDITDVYAHSAMVDGDLWFFLGAATRANNGSSYIDFEFNQQGFTKTGLTEGLVTGNGPDAGRTAGVDFIVSVDFENGGSEPVYTFRKWELTENGFEYIPQVPDPGEVYVCTNFQTVPAPPWGAVSPKGEDTDEVIPFQFVEFAVNLTAMGIDPSLFCTDLSTLLFKTRSSNSFTSELKDLALYQFSILPPPDCTITADQNPLCWGEMTQLCAPVPPLGADYSYEWGGPGAPHADTRCITVDMAGTYTLTVTDNATGCASEMCTFDLDVNALPSCDINFDKNVICNGGSAQFCGPESPSGASYSYAWTGPGGPYPDQRCITVNLEGQYTLTVTDLVAGCSSGTCQEQLTVVPLPQAEIFGPELICQGATTDLCGPEGEYSYNWTGPGGPYPNEICISVSQAGTYTLTITSLVTGCVSEAFAHDLLVAAVPECAITGPSSICPGGEAELCGPEGAATYTWGGPVGTFPNEGCITVASEGTYTLTVTDENGCPAVCEHTLSLDENAAATELSDLWICSGERGEFCVEASGTGPISYQWMKDGVEILGATEPCYTIPAVTEEDEGEYSVEVTGKCGPPVQRSATLQMADVEIQPIDDMYLCSGQTAEFCAVVSGRGPFSYQWKLNGEPIPGAAEGCLVIDGVTDVDEGEYCVEVQGFCGQPVESCALMYVGDCVEHCGLTQGFYGNPGGKWSGLSTLQVLDQLISEENPLVLGVEGARSLTYPEGTEYCVVEHLPADGPPEVLPENLGDAVVEFQTCSIKPKVPMFQNRHRNVLLAQTMTLSLNTRLDLTLEHMLVCEFIIMMRGDHPDNNDIRLAHIPRSVFDALDVLGLPHTVGSLLELANRTLADVLPSNAFVSPGDVNLAAGSINDLVDQCALTIHCESEEDTQKVPDPEDGDIIQSGPALISMSSATQKPGMSFRMTLGANPVRLSSSHVEFSLPEQSNMRLTIYDVRGRVVTDLEDRTVSAGSHSVGFGHVGGMAAGVYFLRMNAVGLESGKRFSKVQKMVVLP